MLQIELDLIRSHMHYEPLVDSIESINDIVESIEDLIESELSQLKAPGPLATEIPIFVIEDTSEINGGSSLPKVIMIPESVFRGTKTKTANYTPITTQQIMTLDLGNKSSVSVKVKKAGIRRQNIGPGPVPPPAITMEFGVMGNKLQLNNGKNLQEENEADGAFDKVIIN